MGKSGRKYKEQAQQRKQNRKLKQMGLYRPKLYREKQEQQEQYRVASKKAS